MAGERTLPGIGLRAYWTAGSNNWEQQHDPDTRKLSVLVQATVISCVTNLPGSPTNGDIYVIPAGQANEKQIAVRDNGAWVYYVPLEGWEVFAKDTDQPYRFDGTVWAVATTPSAWGSITGTLSAQTDLQAALTARELTANKGAANGYAPLDATAKIASAYLPSYVDDVLEYANLAGFPVTGTTGIMYVDLATNKVYRWSGSAYIEISGSPGSTDAVTEGATNLYFTAARVLAAVLAGLSTASAAVVTAADSVLVAIGKLQAQVSARLVAANNLSDLASVPTARTNLGITKIELSFFVSGVFTASEMVFAHVASRTFDLPASLTGSYFYSIVAATASTVFTIKKNGASIGTLTWAAAGTVPTVAFTTLTSFAVGDKLTVEAPVTPDSTLASVVGSFLGSI